MNHLCERCGGRTDGAFARDDDKTCQCGIFIPELDFLGEQVCCGDPGDCDEKCFNREAWVKGGCQPKHDYILSQFDREFLRGAMIKID